MIDILITLLIMIVIFAVIMYALNFIPLDPPLRQLVLLICGVIFLIWLLLTLTGHVGGLRLGGPYR